MNIIPINQAVLMLATIPARGRNLQMAGDPHYQPTPLRPYLGYDNRAGWLVLVEWYWMLALATLGIMPREHAELLTPELLARLLRIRMTKVTELERKTTKHDILALLRLMRAILPKELHRWLHLGCTSYDIICTAYALQIQWTYSAVIATKAREVSQLWRAHIDKEAFTLQSGRTHLQTALPVTAGCWLAVLHSRFADTAIKSEELSRAVCGKFSGAVGTRAAIRALFGKVDVEGEALQLLGLPPAQPSTQLTKPEGMQRFYNELMLMSGALANLGDDVRHLQASEIAEVHSASSTSSAMSHKTSNPVVAEQMHGMHDTVRGEMDKVNAVLVSTLQRVLTGSSIMRGFGAVMLYTYQQLTSAERLFKTLKVDLEQCRRNFDKNGKLVVSELLHLSLQVNGLPRAHEFVNQHIMPKARASGRNLRDEMDTYAKKSRSPAVRQAWCDVPNNIRDQLAYPERYTGDASNIADKESRNRF